MEFTDEQAMLLRDLVAEAVVKRQRANEPIPDRVRSLILHMSIGGSASGTSDLADEARSTAMHRDDQIGSSEAAAIIGCTTRRVRVIGPDLDGRKTGRDWVFSRRKVTEYAYARRLR